MKDVANYRDVQPIDAPLVFANRQGIQQRLGWMFMRSVAGVNDGRVAHSRQVMWRARHRMPDHNTIGRHGFEVACRIEKRFSFGNTRGRHTNIHCVSGKSLGGNLKRSSRAGGGFKEEINDRPPAKRRHFLYFAARDIAKSLSRVEQMSDFFCRQFANSQQMFAVESHGGGQLSVVSGQWSVGLWSLVFALICCLASFARSNSTDQQTN